MNAEISYNDNESMIYSVQICKNRFVDVKAIGNLFYVMQNECGLMVYDNSGKYYPSQVNENKIIEWVKTIDLEMRYF